MKRRIGELIGESYAEQGMSRNQFAEKAGVAVGTLYSVEKGKAWPQPATLRKITDALGWAPRGVQQLLDSGKDPVSVTLDDVRAGGTGWATGAPVGDMGAVELAAELSMRVLMQQREIEELRRRLREAQGD